MPPTPFRAPEGAVLVRVNGKTGLPSRGGAGSIVEAFKPSEVPAGAVPLGQDGQPQAPQAGVQPDGFPDLPGSAEAAPGQPAGAQAAAPQAAPQPPQAAAPPPRRRRAPQRQRGLFRGLF